jgi:hypothetical protein
MHCCEYCCIVHEYSDPRWQNLPHSTPTPSAQPPPPRPSERAVPAPRHRARCNTSWPGGNDEGAAAALAAAALAAAFWRSAPKEAALGEAIDVRVRPLRARAGRPVQAAGQHITSARLREDSSSTVFNSSLNSHGQAVRDSAGNDGNLKQWRRRRRRSSTVEEEADIEVTAVSRP